MLQWWSKVDNLLSQVDHYENSIYKQKQTCFRRFRKKHLLVQFTDVTVTILFVNVIKLSLVSQLDLENEHNVLVIVLVVQREAHF